MKILQINSVCGFGSTGRIATDLYKVYEDAGHECVIGYGRGMVPDGYKTIKIGSDIDNYLHVAKTRILDKHGFGSKRATEKFVEEVKKFNPDVIHLHNIHGYYINIEVLFNYLKESNKKVVWTLHDCWTFTGHCAYFDYVGCDKWKTECLKCPQKKEYPSSKILDSSLINYKKKQEIFTGLNDMTIVTPSKWLARLVKESFLKKYEVVVINNGIDLDIFKPIKSDFRERYGIGEQKIILGVASIWDRRKGLNYFVELANNLEHKFKIVIVGVTEKQKKELPNNIISIVRTNNVEELVEIYSAADIYFNPTLEDNFPTTNLEAISCGTPIVTSNRGGGIEVVNKKTGAIIAVEKLLDIKKIVTTLEENFRDIDIESMDLYDKKNCFSKYIDLVEEK